MVNEIYTSEFGKVCQRNAPCKYVIYLQRFATEENFI